MGTSAPSAVRLACLYSPLLCSSAKKSASSTRNRATSSAARRHELYELEPWRTRCTRRGIQLVIGSRCHESYVIILCGTWEAAVRGFPERERERETHFKLVMLSLSFFSVASYTTFVCVSVDVLRCICMIEGTPGCVINVYRTH